MKITRRQLQKIVLESLYEQDSEELKTSNPTNIEIGIKETNIVFKLKIDSNGKATAIVENEDTGSIIETYNDANDESTKEKIFGFLRIGMEEAKDKDTKLKISDACATLLGDSIEDADRIKNLEKYLADRRFAAYAQNIRAEKEFLSARPGTDSV